jgi:hypothetical protein
LGIINQTIARILHNYCKNTFVRKEKKDMSEQTKQLREINAR